MINTYSRLILIHGSYCLRVSFLSALLLAFGCNISFAHNSNLPNIASNQNQLISLAEEQQIGQLVAGSLNQVTNSQSLAIKLWLNDIVRPLINHSSLDDKQLQFFLVNNKNINKDMLTKFLDSIEKATQYIINHPDETWKIFSNYSKELNNELNEMAWYDTIPRFALRPAALDKRRYTRFEDFLYEEGLIDKKYSFEKMAIEIY